MSPMQELPSSSLPYYLLYGGTLVVHLLLVTYLIVGASIVGARAVWKGSSESFARIESVARDWLPFALGTAITAGVAPLLFVQILYKESFYTANLLLFHRWMAIVPVLIVAFYSLYWIKSDKASDFPRLSGLVRWLPLVAFLFVGWSWSENHALMNERGDWVGLFESGQLFYTHPSVLPRLAIFLGLCFAVAPFMLGLQVRKSSPEAIPRLAVIGLAGLAVLAAGLVFHGDAPPGAGVGLAVVGGGTLTMALAWGLSLRTPPRRSVLVLGLSAGALTIAATVFVRELARLSSFDLPALAAHQERAASSAGLVTFAVFLVINLLVIVGCVRLVARGLAETASE